MQNGAAALILLNRLSKQLTFAMTKFDFEEMDHWLNRWGIWARKDSIRLGYPNRTAESKINEGSQNIATELNQPVEETIEQIVNLLPLQLRKIAKAEYLWREGATKKLRAEKLNLTEAKYKSLVTATQWSVLSILGARKDLINNLPKI
jgi:response regulator RpfG family c-di-GMP phosphodiesterase